MKSAIFAISILIFGTIFSEGQIIKGKIVIKLGNIYEPLPAITVNIDSLFCISNLDGEYILRPENLKSDSILFKGSYCATIKIINLPSNFDTLNLGTIEMIEHKMISQKQYDSICNVLIKTFKPDIYIVQKSKADKLLREKFSPIYHWAELLGYIVSGEVVSNEMIHPFEKAKMIIFQYDTVQDMIILNYKNLFNN